MCIGCFDVLKMFLMLLEGTHVTVDAGAMTQDGTYFLTVFCDVERFSYEQKRMDVKVVVY